MEISSFTIASICLPSCLWVLWYQQIPGNLEAPACVWKNILRVWKWRHTSLFLICCQPSKAAKKNTTPYNHIELLLCDFFSAPFLSHWCQAKLKSTFSHLTTHISSNLCINSVSSCFVVCPKVSISILSFWKSIYKKNNAKKRIRGRNFSCPLGLCREGHPV